MTGFFFFHAPLRPRSDAEAFADPFAGTLGLGVLSRVATRLAETLRGRSPGHVAKKATRRRRRARRTRHPAKRNRVTEGVKPETPKTKSDNCPPAEDRRNRAPGGPCALPGPKPEDKPRARGRRPRRSGERAVLRGPPAAPRSPQEDPERRRGYARTRPDPVQDFPT